MVSYNCEMKQLMRIEVFDADDAANDVRQLDLARQDKLGFCEFALADAAWDTSKPLMLNLQGQGAQGTCHIATDEVIDLKKALVCSGMPCCQPAGFPPSHFLHLPSLPFQVQQLMVAPEESRNADHHHEGRRADQSRPVRTLAVSMWLHGVALAASDRKLLARMK